VVGSSSGPKGPTLLEKASRIRLLLTDCDGVLTDGSVYYSERGEALKCFNIRDGMGVERLRKLANIETGIITGELSESVQRRAEKLKITCLELGCKNKILALDRVASSRDLSPESIAYIGDDVNDLGIMGLVGLTAAPADAMPEVKKAVDVVCHFNGGRGAFREFAEFILSAQVPQREVGRFPTE
jgi:3-deoxy-D-manno-octulosonate 8-phosphate phosphatase (KDO 8-P phosphatase)